MATYLLLGNTDDSWRLPADADTDQILEELRDAFDGADLADVEVEMNNGQRLTIHVNPEAIGWWSIYEEGE